MHATYNTHTTYNISTYTHRWYILCTENMISIIMQYKYIQHTMLAIALHTQTAFSSYIFEQEKGSGECPSYINFVLQILSFWGFFAWLLIGVKG